MDLLTELFGESKNLSALHMCTRAIAITLIALFLLRIAGRRSFGMKSPFDNAIVILLGSVLSRAIVGASPFLPTIAAALVIVLLHRLIAWVSIKHSWVSRLAKGNKLLLYKDGKFYHENMRRALISEDDLLESIRATMHQDDYSDIQCAYMEKRGEISLIKKSPTGNTMEQII